MTAEMMRDHVAKLSVENADQLTARDIHELCDAAEEAILAQLESAAEIKALDNVLLTGYKTYPSNPFTELEKTPSGYTNGSDSGQDDAWWFASNKVYHRRNGNVYYWDYNPVNGEIN